MLCVLLSLSCNLCGAGGKTACGGGAEDMEVVAPSPGAPSTGGGGDSGETSRPSDTAHTTGGVTRSGPSGRRAAPSAPSSGRKPGRQPACGKPV